MGHGMSLQKFAFDLGTLQRDLERTGAAAPLVISRALNRAATSGKTATTRAIVADTGLASRHVAAEIKIDKAQRTDPVVVVEIRGRRFPLLAFGARGPEPSRGRGHGVAWRGAGGSRKRERRAFIATMRSGHRGVFLRTRFTPAGARYSKRSGKNREVFVELKGPSLPLVFEKQFPVFRTAAGESLVKNLRSEINYALSKVRDR